MTPRYTHLPKADDLSLSQASFAAFCLTKESIIALRFSLNYPKRGNSCRAASLVSEAILSTASPRTAAKRSPTNGI